MLRALVTLGRSLELSVRLGEGACVGCVGGRVVGCVGCVGGRVVTSVCFGEDSLGRLKEVVRTVAYPWPSSSSL